MHLHLHLHKRALIAIIVSVIVLGAFGGGIYWYVEERPLQNVSITVDFDQLQTSHGLPIVRTLGISG